MYAFDREFAPSSLTCGWMYSTTAFRGGLAAALLLVVAALPMAAQAETKTPVVISGSATFTKNGNELDIIQTTDKLQINWVSFNIDEGETVRFFQPDKNSIVLNRVIGGERTEIYGTLLANGQVWIVNGG